MCGFPPEPPEAFFLDFAMRFVSEENCSPTPTPTPTPTWGRPYSGKSLDATSLPGTSNRSLKWSLSPKSAESPAVWMSF